MSPNKMNPDEMNPLCILYDYLYVPGGAERVTQTLVRGLAPADLCVAGVYPACAGLDLPTYDLGLRAHHPLLRALGALRRFTRPPAALHRYPTLLWSGMYAPLARRALPSGGQRHFYYCHTPPRFVYDLRDYYRQQAGWPGAWALDALRAWYRPRYEAALRGMHAIAANSETVRQRLRQHTGLEACVIHPPVDVDCWAWQGQQEYFVSLARHENYKRVEVIIDAFLGLPQHRLVVASGGSLSPALRKRAADAGNIRFTGWLSDTAQQRLVGESLASIYLPHDEDFGMSPVESMAAGKPVIGVAEGGIRETVRDGETGVLLPPDFTVEHLREAITRMTPTRAAALRHACEARANQFSRERFLTAMRAWLQTGQP